MNYYTKILFRVYNASMYCNDLKVSQNRHLLTISETCTIILKRWGSSGVINSYFSQNYKIVLTLKRGTHLWTQLVTNIKSGMVLSLIR